MQKLLLWFAAIVGFLALVGGMAFLFAMCSGWVLMLLLGAIHHSVWPAVPAFSYWQSVLIAFTLSFISGIIRGVSLTFSKD